MGILGVGGWWWYLALIGQTEVSRRRSRRDGATSCASGSGRGTGGRASATLLGAGSVGSVPRLAGGLRRRQRAVHSR